MGPETTSTAYRETLNELRIARRLLSRAELRSTQEFRAYLTMVGAAFEGRGARSKSETFMRVRRASRSAAPAPLRPGEVERLGFALRASRELLEATAATFAAWCRARDAIDPECSAPEQVPARLIRHVILAEEVPSPFPSLGDMQVDRWVRDFTG